MKRSSRRKLNSAGITNCEICNQPNYLVQHHIRGRDIPDPHHFSNLANICANCHNKVHWGDIIIENRVMTTNGYVVIWHHKSDQSITGNDASVYLL